MALLFRESCPTTSAMPPFRAPFPLINYVNMERASLHEVAFQVPSSLIDDELISDPFRHSFIFICRVSERDGLIPAALRFL